jgi:hypothetical protein
MKNIFEKIKKYKYLILVGLLFLLLYLAGELYKPKLPETPIYNKIQESEVKFPGAAKIVTTSSKSNEANSDFSVKFVFDKPTDPNGIKVTVNPPIQVKVVRYTNPLEVTVLPTNGAYWENGVTYSITLENKDTQNPVLESQVSHIHKFSYLEEDNTVKEMMVPGHPIILE